MAKSFKDLVNPKKFSWGGANLLIFIVMLIVALVEVYLPFNGKPAGSLLKPTFLNILTVLAVFGIVFGEIGDRIPIFNDYIGGGTILVFLAAAVFGTYKWVPASVLKSIKIFYIKPPVDFLGIFIPVLIVGSILTIDRKQLLRSVAGYIPLIIVGVIGASIGGVVVGLIFGKAPIDVMLNYVLPIMGGGTGAGAIPMSEMWASRTGRPANEWFAFAISILTIANIIAIITGGLLKGLGRVKPNLTGNGELVINQETKEEKEAEKKAEAKAELSDIAIALFFTGILAMIGDILSKLWGLLHLQFEIHRLAFLVIIVILLNVANLVPLRIKAGAKIMQKFFAKYTLWILMAAVGFGTNMEDILKALTLSNLLVSLAIVYGAVVLIMLLAKKMKFYPIEAAITAGLCMANRGGSGDIAVLGAADRMELISFAQISSRIGGAMMLILASILFGIYA